MLLKPTPGRKNPKFSERGELGPVALTNGACKLIQSHMKKFTE